MRVVSPSIRYSPRRSEHAGGGLLAVGVPDDELGDHRVVGRADLPAGGDAGVHAHTRAGRLAVLADAPGGGGEVTGGVLGVDAALDRVTPEHDVVLGERQGIARGDADALLHDVDAGDHLGDAVLDLHPGVHLQEEVLAVLEQALDGAGAAVADGLGGVGGDLPDALAQRVVDDGGGGLLDELLVAALDRAVALPQMQRVAVGVGEDLHLDVARVGEVALQVDGGVGEEPLALPGRALEGALQLVLGQGDAEALPTAAAGGLHRHRVADLPRCGAGRVEVGDRVGGARHDRNSRGLHELTRTGLGAHRLDRARRWPDEHHAGVLARLREGCVLGQEPVAGVHGLRAGLAHDLQQPVDVEVAALEQIGLVGAPRVQRVAVDLGVHGDRCDPELLQRPDDPHRDLPTVGHEHLAEHRAGTLGDTKAG